MKENKEQTETINEAQRENADLSRKFDELRRVDTNRALWLDFTVNLLQRRPAPILVERLEISPQGVVDLQGRTSRQQAISEFYNELKQETEFIQSARLVSLGTPVEDSRFETRVFPFTMRITTYNRQGRYESMIRGLGTVAVAEPEAEEGEAEDEAPRQESGRGERGGGESAPKQPVQVPNFSL